MTQETKTEVASRSSDPVLPEAKISDERREAMRKIGKYTAYVAPAMLALVSTRNHAIS